MDAISLFLVFLITLCQVAVGIAAFSQHQYFAAGVCAASFCFTFAQFLAMLSAWLRHD
jgi:hypothetical protein